MQTDLIVSSNAETHLHSETIVAHVGDQGIAASTPDHVIEPLPGILSSFLFYVAHLTSFLPLICFYWFMQQKGLLDNGLLGHVKRRKVSSLHYGKLARYVAVHLLFIFVNMDAS